MEYSESNKYYELLTIDHTLQMVLINTKSLRDNRTENEK